jgi:hypothetical protein
MLPYMMSLVTGSVRASRALWRRLSLARQAAGSRRPGWRRGKVGDHLKRYTIHFVFDVAKVGLDVPTSTHQRIERHDAVPGRDS